MESVKVNNAETGTTGNSSDHHVHGSPEHQKYHEEHKGHESMHAEMFLILMLTLLAMNIGLAMWRKHHFRSYQLLQLFPNEWRRDKLIDSRKNWFGSREMGASCVSFVGKFDVVSATESFLMSFCCHVLPVVKAYRAQAASLVGLLVVPVTMSLSHGWYRFVTIWTTFCLLTALVMVKATQKPVTVTTPRSPSIRAAIRMVYKYFYGVHLLSGFLSVTGYCMLLFGMFGLNFLFLVEPKSWFDVGLHLLFYGFYYGVIGRDLADVVTDKMAVRLGYYSADGMPAKKLDSRTCALCANPLLVQEGQEAVVENTFRLTCGHQFHEFCLKGWCIVGKKEVCPYCKERFNMKAMYKNPWDRPHVLLGQYLDLLRYFLAWLPLVLYSDQLIYKVLGLS